MSMVLKAPRSMKGKHMEAGKQAFLVGRDSQPQKRDSDNLMDFSGDWRLVVDNGLGGDK